MEKYIYDEKNGLWYELQGKFFVPCLKLPAEIRNRAMEVVNNDLIYA